MLTEKPFTRLMYHALHAVSELSDEKQDEIARMMIDAVDEAWMDDDDEDEEVDCFE